MIHSSTSEPLQWFETEPAESHIIMIAPVHIPGDLFIAPTPHNNDMNITYNLTSATDYLPNKPHSNNCAKCIVCKTQSYDQEVI